MTSVQHLYVTAHGAWLSGPWVGEAAQFGVRLAIVAASAVPEKGTVFTIGGNGDCVADQGQTAGTHGTLTRTWTARAGGVGSTENLDAGFQVDVAEDVWTFLNSVKTYQRASFAWTHVKVSPVSAAGKAIETAAIYQFTAALAGTGTAQYPPQIATAISMRANILGRRGRGRIYLPATASAMGNADATLEPGVGTTLRTAFKTFIENVYSTPGATDYHPLVCITSPGQAQAVRPSEVRTGNRFDTIRSRREQVPESYTATAL